MTEQTIPIFAFFILKIIILIGIGVYAVFAGIMIRQEHLMANVLEENFEPILRMLTYIHLALTIIVFFLAVILL
jgi:hypothetical protein